MAGFAIFITVLIYGTLVFAAASVASLCLFLFTRRRVSPAYPKRNKALAFISFTPFLAIAWLVIALLLHVSISNQRYQTGAPIAGPGYVRSLIDVDLHDGRFTGTRWDFDSSSIRRFTFDTRTLKYEVSAPQAAASFGEVETKAHTDSHSYWKLYAANRHAWPNYVLVLLLLFGEGAICIRAKEVWVASTRQPSRDSAELQR